MVLKPGREEVAREIFRKWELDFAIIGQITDTGRMVLTFHGETVCDIPIPPLVTEAPVYERPWVPTPLPATLAAQDVPAPADWRAAVLRIAGCPDIASKRWIWEQYDCMVRGDTVQRPGGDAAVVRVHDTAKALAMTSDCTPRYCQAHPETGGRQAVAEAWRNLIAVGARPLAITDNLNFGNPTKPEVMGQFVGCVTGMAEACRALDFPVISGNVSLYNETEGRAITPTPVVGGVGLIEELDRTVGIALPAGTELVLVGDTQGHLGQSLYLREIEGREEGAPPPVDLAVERRNGELVRRLIEARMLRACHDLSDGGLLVAALEMALAGGVGCTLEAPPAGMPAHAFLFGEDQARYLVATDMAVTVLSEAEKVGVPARRIGRAGGDALTVSGLVSISLEELRRTHEAWLPGYMESAA